MLLKTVTMSSTISRHGHLLGGCRRNRKPKSSLFLDPRSSGTGQPSISDTLPFEPR